MENVLESNASSVLDAQRVLLAEAEAQNARRKRGNSSTATSDYDLESATLAWALQESTRRQSVPLESNVNYESEEAQLDLAIEMSQQEAKTETVSDDEGEDMELARALEVSDRVYSSMLDQEDAHELARAEAVEDSKDHAAEMEVIDSVLRRKRQRSEESNIGSWDCPMCTYTNAPYKPQCQVCDTAPPAHTLTFREISELRFGVEIEIIIPGAKADGFDLQSVADNLSKMGPTVTFCGYTKQTCPEWKLVTDMSVQSENPQDLCFELVSPVLCGEAGLGSLRSVMENVRKLAITTNSSCGFHVHVDATPYQGREVPKMASLRGLVRVAQCFVSLENAFDLVVAAEAQDRRTNRNQFCGSNRLSFGADSNRQRWNRLGSVKSRQSLVDHINPRNDRYMKLNMTNLVNPSRPSTVEFRHHGGVEDLTEAEAWVRFVLRFCERASTRCPESNACLLPESSGPIDELRALFALVDCEGLEHFFVADRKLFGTERLKNEWQCGRCGRSFRNSRALSQHCSTTGHGP